MPTLLLSLILLSCSTPKQNASNVVTAPKPNDVPDSSITAGQYTSPKYRSDQNFEDEKHQVYNTTPYHVDSRKMQYLYYTDFATIAFWDNGTATEIREFFMCKANLYYLQRKPPKYNWQKYGDILVLADPTNTKDGGVSLNSSNWIIKDFELVNRISDCVDSIPE